MMKNQKKSIRCPRCGTQTVWQENPCRPFCSEMCQQVDLGRWASEDYRIAGKPAPAADEDTDIYFGES